MREKSGLWLFFVLVFCWSWGFWLAAAILGVSTQAPTGYALMLAGLLGPFLGGLGFARFTGSAEDWRDYCSRLIDPRRIGPGWILIVVLFVPALLVLAELFDFVTTGGDVLVPLRNTLAPFLATPAAILPFLLSVLVMGPLPEEPGWRGYALDRLLARWNAPMASLILGVVWATWHVPLFFMKDTFHASQGAWTAWFWLFLVQVVATAMVMTWIFINTQRSTLAAVLFHFVANLTYILANMSPRTNFYATILWVAAAAALAIAAGRKRASG